MLALATLSKMRLLVKAEFLMVMFLAPLTIEPPAIVKPSMVNPLSLVLKSRAMVTVAPLCLVIVIALFVPVQVP